ncbi:MAG: hypothetical protein AAGG01_15240 [Planctomycetota bacterium]
MLKPLLLTISALSLLACGGASEGDVSAAPAGSEAAPKAQTVALEAGVRELRCGCKIDGIGTCGNYVAEGDDWLEISNREAHGLGKMEWCRVPATVKVEGIVAGNRTGDQIEITTLTLAE